MLRAQAVFENDLLEANECCMHIRSCTRTCMVQGCYLVSQSTSKGCALYAWTLDQTLIAEEKEWQLCPYHLKTIYHISNMFEPGVALADAKKGSRKMGFHGFSLICTCITACFP